MAQPLWKTLLAGAVLALSGATTLAQNPRAVRVGYFPNVTHAPAIVGFSPQKRTFYQAFPGVTFNNTLFNAGPSAIEALRAGALDMCFIGGGPAINAYARGKDVVIVAGVAAGGSVLVARNGGGITNVKSLSGRRVAIPQLGNTQDVLLRHQLSANGLRSSDKGGTVTVLPVENPDILALFQRGQLDAACVPEPWGARLEKEAGAKVVLGPGALFRNGQYPTTVLIARADFASRNPRFVRRFVRVTNNITRGVQDRKAAFAGLLNSEIKRLSGKALKDEVLVLALRRTTFTPRLQPADVNAFSGLLRQAGYQKAGADLNGILWK